MKYPPEKCIESLKKANEEVNGNLSYSDYRSLDISPSLNTIEKRFDTFNNAKEAAGIKTMTRGEYQKTQPPHIGMTNEGYIRCQSKIGSSNSDDQIVDSFVLHRLVAVSKYGIEKVKGKQVHHKNGIPWDNRPKNLELMSASDHIELHNEARNRDEKGRFID